MKKPLNYSITWVENGVQNERIIFSHKTLLEEYLHFLSLGSRVNISSLKAWKVYRNAPAEEYTCKLNKFIEYGK